MWLGCPLQPFIFRNVDLALHFFLVFPPDYPRPRKAAVFPNFAQPFLLTVKTGDQRNKLSLTLNWKPSCKSQKRDTLLACVTLRTMRNAILKSCLSIFGPDLCLTVGCTSRWLQNRERGHEKLGGEVRASFKQG
jgi:hypothetical protein